MGEVQGGDRRLTDIGVDVSRQAAEPDLDGVQALRDRREIAPLNHLLDEAQLLRGDGGVLVPHRDRGGDIGVADLVGPKFLQGQVRVGGLIGRVAG